MQVLDRLAAVAPDVRHHTIPRLGQPFLPGDLSREARNLAELQWIRGTG